MCVYSMILDQFQPKFEPWINPPIPTNPYPIGGVSVMPNADALRELLAAFAAAQAAAKIVDKAMDAPDCEDEEKLKLLERVAELEKALAASRGTYVLKDGNWYLHPSGAYTTDRGSARRFPTRETAIAAADLLDPRPKVISLVLKRK